jgi:undecaprenyl-diphosphatase
MRPAEDGLSLRQVVALGLLQGPAELLPVSSSAHTTLLPWLAGWSYGELDGELRKSFEVALHAGAGLALSIEMRAELLRQARSLDARRLVVHGLALAPASVAGYALRGPIERWLGGPRSIAAGLLAGAVAMAVLDARPGAGERKCEDARALDGLALGIAQASALIPGISRNGATLTAARARGFTREAAQALSWNAALPVILGASVLKGGRLLRRATPRDERVALALGGVSAFLSTLASARILRRGSGAGGGAHEGRALFPYSLYRCLLAALVVRRLRRAQ